MESLLLVRERFGLTQVQIAVYLSVSESLVKMAEAGLRSLPTAALLQLTALAQMNLTGPDARKTKKAAVQPGSSRYLANTAELHLYQAQKLKQKLEKMQAKYRQAQNCQILINQLRGQPPKGAAAKKDRLWLDALQPEVSKKLQQNSPAEQAILQWKADCLKFSAARAKTIIRAYVS